ncbi:MAG TPA: ATP-binding cassette domain-containing protein, partial [Candidatus Anaerotruncus excrementipullorum]|nr:ATP-binding cassette domain-containing protein [Candidatus Anaerotruncus excrementipullorum]
METVLEVKNLSKTFTQREGKGLAAVRQVSFSLAAGERLGIVGESGSGKTTLARLVTRLTDPTEGQVFLEGEEITRLKGAALRPVYRKLQMVFQSPQGSFDPRRRVGEGVGESLANLGVPREARR